MRSLRPIYALNSNGHRADISALGHSQTHHKADISALGALKVKIEMTDNCTEIGFSAEIWVYFIRQTDSLVLKGHSGRN